MRYLQGVSTVVSDPFDFSYLYGKRADLDESPVVTSVAIGRRAHLSSLAA
jgi:hypothetical protein